MRALLAISLLMLVACAGSGMKTSQYNEALASVEIGMQKTEFAAMFPKATARGAKGYPNGSVVEVLELVVSEYRFAPSGDPSYTRNIATGTESRVTWFYFYNGRLVQYGMPNDWPANPDAILEVRSR